MTFDDEVRSMIGRFILGFSVVGSLVIGSSCDVLFRGGTFRCETFCVCIVVTLFLHLRSTVVTCNIY